MRWTDEEELERERDELRAENEQLREAIARHRRAKEPKTEEAKRFYGLPSFADSALWETLSADAEEEVSHE